MGKINGANLKKTIFYLRRNGLKSTLTAVREKLDSRLQPAYLWEAPTEQELARQRRTAEREGFTVSFSIVVPAYRTPEIYLREMIASVCGQSYENWELILADATEDDRVARIAESFADFSDRIRCVRLTENAGISENTNAGILLAEKEYVGLLDHDDILEKNALFEIAAVIERARRNGTSLKLIYTDEDKCSDDKSRYYEPNFKEKFNLDLLLTNNYICHFMVMERELIKELRLRKEYEGAQDFDLVLRAAERLMGAEEQISHVAKVLYHWRCHTSSTAENPQSKLYAYEAGRRAVQDFLDRRGWPAEARDTAHLGFYRIVYRDSPLAVRKELGALGGRLIRKGRTLSGRISDTGDIFYRGLPKSYGGYLHRAMLAQDADALDIRNIEVAASARGLFEKLTGIPYVTRSDSEVFDPSSLPEDTDYIALSIQVGRELRRQGYRLLYLPERTMEL